MLVVISDLHFVDGTAGEQDVPWQAFENVFLSDIAELADHNNAKEIKLLLLGDVIDLLRTRKWLETDTEDRPWGKNGLKDIKEFDPQKGSKTEKHCCWILV
jgi:UDP-2,3-diacylglucosamine pyrophosphatase LpxH